MAEEPAESSITFNTAKGAKLVVTRGDERIRTLTSLYDDLTSEGDNNIPDTVVLSGAVGDIMDEEHERYRAMLWRVDILHKQLLTVTMSRLLFKNPIKTLSSNEVELRHLGIVYYQDVERIGRIFDWIDWDYMGVNVNAKTPKHLRMTYYAQLGRHLTRMYRDAPELQRLYSGHTILSKVIRLVYGPERWKKAAHSITGMAYNALILTMNKMMVNVDTDIDERVIVWDDLLTICEEAMVDTEPQPGDDDTIQFLNYITSRPSNVHIDAITHVIFSRSKPMFAIAAMRPLPENVNPIEIGLGGVLDPAYIVGGILLDEVDRLRLFIDERFKRVYANVTVIGSRALMVKFRYLVGDYLLNRILLSLLHYLEAGNKSKRVNSFAKAIEALD